MFENLTERLQRSFKFLKGKHRITELNIADSIKEIRRALIDADVNYKIAKEFTERIKEKALGEKVLTAIDPGEQMVKIVYDELVDFMGGETADIDLSGKPSVVLLAGLQGSGKTTFAVKLANFLRKRKNKKPILIAADVYRPAAIEQLKILGEKAQIPVYSEEDNKNPVQIAQNGIKYAKENGYDLVIIDTAGRLAIDEQMMKEISDIKKAVNPNEILFVVDAMTGQDAVNTAKEFNEVLDFNGVVLSKLDGDTRGGAALTIKYVVNKPIKFISNGEKIQDIDFFHPDRMAKRILGFGDLGTVLERVQEVYDEEQAKQLQKKIAKEQFDFNDFLQQIQQIKKLGNLKELISLIPGVGKMAKDLDLDDDSFKHIEAIIYSMTPEERQKPEILNGSRKKRIAKGSGTSVEEVNGLIKNFMQMRKMMKMMTNKNPHKQHSKKKKKKKKRR